MRVCTNDSRHENFRVSAIERHDWVVTGDGDFIKDEGCYDSTIAEGCEWICAECGSVTVFVKPIDQMSTEELRRKLSELRRDIVEVILAREMCWKHGHDTRGVDGVDWAVKLDLSLNQLKETTNLIVGEV